jgi:hypothetical protein
MQNISDVEIMACTITRYRAVVAEKFGARLGQGKVNLSLVLLRGRERPDMMRSESALSTEH